jgi:hypothetical protein
MTRLILLGLGLVVLGCSSLTGPGRERVIGTLEHHGDSVVVSVPDTVAAGEAFTVAVRTYGGGCMEKGDTEVEVRGLRATVTPYDIRVEADVCTAILKLFEHTATLHFEGAGTAEVVMRGRKEPEGEILTVGRTVVVR